MKHIRAIVAATLLGFPVAAQDAPLTDVSVEALIENLTPQPILAFRGVDVVETERPSVDLAIEFDYNSANLTDQAREMLAVLAEALSSDALSALRFELAGHTDAVGSDIYNDALSLDRAQAVADHLITVLGIERNRLDITGYGETRLLFPDQPEDGRNRRVEVRTIEIN